MSDRDQNKHREGDESLLREAWTDARFSMDGALLQASGGGLLSGSDQVSALELARREIRGLLRQQLRDTVLEKALEAWIDLHQQQFERHVQTPVTGLLHLLEQTLQREGLFVEFVRTVDVHYGQIMQERPRFQQPGDPPHPDDPHTFDSVRKTLEKLADTCRHHA